MGGPNLEVFKFGMYIMFPIGWMYYFGTNLDSKFSVPDFWPRPEQQHKIPFERDEIESELQRLQRRRLALREKRLREEEFEKFRREREMGQVAGGGGGVDGSLGVQEAVSGLRGFERTEGGPLDRLGDEAAQEVQRTKKSWGDWVRGR
ncbi:hypothetical protein E2P81_ATG07338 [Venturia nashicola]|uniref:Mitochondrial cytochrome c oxidase assembly factor n=1 Tax=Venturia nashicola TaxID=86259 RepID=A0A4Z1P1I7_9PEZI|nr:hypothetical protein E6O75_ATG07493 [Venturia nashicola]TLD31848.1 hypothetical protein E2P81_ATG07338 [Venturia nashicola]